MSDTNETTNKPNSPSTRTVGTQTSKSLLPNNNGMAMSPNINPLQAQILAQQKFEFLPHTTRGGGPKMMPMNMTIPPLQGPMPKMMPMKMKMGGPTMGGRPLIMDSAPSTPFPSNSPKPLDNFSQQEMMRLWLRTHQCVAEVSTRINVHGIEGSVTTEILREHFAKYGSIFAINITSPGSAFVQFDNTDDAERAKDKMDGFKLNGSRLRIKLVDDGIGRIGGNWKNIKSIDDDTRTKSPVPKMSPNTQTIATITTRPNTMTSQRSAPARFYGLNRDSMKGIGLNLQRVVDVSRRLYVHGLAGSVTTEVLQEHFGKYGSISFIKIMYRNSALVEFEMLPAAIRAKDKMNGFELNGSRLRVDSVDDGVDRCTSKNIKSIAKSPAPKMSPNMQSSIRPKMINAHSMSRPSLIPPNLYPSLRSGPPGLVNAMRPPWAGGPMGMPQSWQKPQNIMLPIHAMPVDRMPSQQEMTRFISRSIAEAKQREENWQAELLWRKKSYLPKYEPDEKLYKELHEWLKNQPIAKNPPAGEKSTGSVVFKLQGAESILPYIVLSNYINLAGKHTLDLMVLNKSLNKIVNAKIRKDCKVLVDQAMVGWLECAWDCDILDSHQTPEMMPMGVPHGPGRDRFDKFQKKLRTALKECMHLIAERGSSGQVIRLFSKCHHAVHLYSRIQEHGNRGKFSKCLKSFRKLRESWEAQVGMYLPKGFGNNFESLDKFHFVQGGEFPREKLKERLQRKYGFSSDE